MADTWSVNLKCNRLTSLLIASDTSIGVPFDEDDDKAEVLDADQHSQQYSSMTELLRNEEDLTVILQHPVFLQCQTQEILMHLHSGIMERAQHFITEKSGSGTTVAQTLHYMELLNKNPNYMHALIRDKISNRLKWNKMLKSLQKLVETMPKSPVNSLPAPSHPPSNHESASPLS